jgi:hypothetical protein
MVQLISEGNPNDHPADVIIVVSIDWRGFGGLNEFDDFYPF